MIILEYFWYNTLKIAWCYTKNMTPNPNKKSQQEFGKNIRKMRKQKGFSQEEVAKMSKISTTYYAGIERGEENPTFSVIENICKALKIKSSEILP